MTAVVDALATAATAVQRSRSAASSRCSSRPVPPSAGVEPDPFAVAVEKGADVGGQGVLGGEHHPAAAAQRGLRQPQPALRRAVVGRGRVDHDVGLDQIGRDVER